MVSVAQQVTNNKRLMLRRQIALIDFNPGAGTLIARFSAVELWGFVMSGEQVTLDPSKLLGFSQLAKVAADAPGGTDALFNKRGGETGSPPPQPAADSLFNKRGEAPVASQLADALFNKRGEVTSPTLRRAADALFNKRGETPSEQVIDAQ
jgi:hypothetical protein